MMSTIGNAISEDRQGQVSEKIDMLDKAIEELSILPEKFYEKLSLVTVPVSMEKLEKSPREDHPPMVPLANKLSMLLDAVQDITRQFRTLFESIEL